MLAFEDAAGVIESASSLAVVNCVCRGLVRNCDEPLDVCLQLNRGADYNVKRGTGKRLSVDEALEVLRRAEDADLVHTVENRGKGNVICNGCDCCCDMLKMAKRETTRHFLAPSRYRATVSTGDCTLCGICIEDCPLDAVSLDDDRLAESTLSGASVAAYARARAQSTPSGWKSCDRRATFRPEIWLGAPTQGIRAATDPNRGLESQSTDSAIGPAIGEYS